MSLKRLLDCRHTLACRLTLWYAFFFLVSTLLTFKVFLAMTTSYNRANTDNELVMEYEEFTSLFEEGGLEALSRAIAVELKVEGADRFFFRLVDRGGQEKIVTEQAAWKTVLPSGPELTAMWPAAGYQIYPVSRNGRSHGAHVLYGHLGPGHLCQIALDRVSGERFLDTLQQVANTTVFLVGLLAAATGLFLARRALSCVNSLTSTAREITAGDLDRRVEISGGGREIVELAQTFNAMLDRINQLLAGMAEMTDNIAHDLKSPLTRMRAMAEVVLLGDDKGADCQDFAADIIEQCDILRELVNTMLLISEAEAGAANFQKEPVDMGVLVRDACELFLPLAEDSDIELTASLAPRCRVLGDLNLLQRLVANLLDNAIKYSSPGGKVTVGVSGDERLVTVAFQDRGVGIAEADLAHIFDRFYRCDQSRTRPGSGLGLSLARAIITCHGGDIQVESTSDQGTIFTITLPRFLAA